MTLRDRTPSSQADCRAPLEAKVPSFLPSLLDMNGSPAPTTGGTTARDKPRLLLAEDEPSTREFLHEILLAHSAVTVALDGAQAIDAARRVPPDLVLSNVVMPVADGIDLTRWLRTNPSTATVPIILLSANNLMETVRRGLEAGASDYLLKPFRPKELLALVASLLK